jgi:hypothetical protein
MAMVRRECWSKPLTSSGSKAKMGEEEIGVSQSASRAYPPIS